jgi:YggT family protein
MGEGYLGDTAAFLVSTLLGLYVLALLLRFLLQWARADFYNPISQFLVRVTSPALRPLRRYIPGYGGVDLASLLLMLALKILEWWLVLAVRGVSPAPGGVFFLAVADLLSLLINVYLVSILVQAVLSWVNPGPYRNPLSPLLNRLNEPLLGPARRLLPPVSGFDLSPIVVLILLQVTSMLVVAPIRDLGRGLLL